MSNPTFDTVETTLKSLKDIVDRNHSQSVETSRLVENMELLIAEMKAKTPPIFLLDNGISSFSIDTPSLEIHDKAFPLTV